MWRLSNRPGPASASAEAPPHRPSTWPAPSSTRCQARTTPARGRFAPPRSTPRPRRRSRWQVARTAARFAATWPRLPGAVGPFSGRARLAGEATRSMGLSPARGSSARPPAGGRRASRLRAVGSPSQSVDERGGCPLRPGLPPAALGWLVGRSEERDRRATPAERDSFQPISRRRRGHAKMTVQTRPRLFPLVRPAEPAGES